MDQNDDFITDDERNLLAPWSSFAAFRDIARRLAYAQSKGVSGGPNVVRELDLDGGRTWMPAADVSETGDDFVVSMLLPGVQKEDVHIDIKERRLTVDGERFREKENGDSKVLRREQFYGKFHRCIELPEQMDVSKARAYFKDGVLVVRVKRSETAKPRRVRIEDGE